MAEIADYSSASPSAESTSAQSEAIVFHGVPKNMAVGVSMVLAGTAAFVMGMTDVFFAEAMAYIFIVWGVLYLIGDLADWSRTWAVADDGLHIGAPFTLTNRHKFWEWPYVNRMDLIVKRNNPRISDIVMQVYYSPPGDTVLYREDRVLSPQLAQLIIEHAKLLPTHKENPSNLEEIASEKTTYTWNKTGKTASS
jgi:hypothetical protein